MGQYFQVRNLSRKESVKLPGGMKAVERVTDIAAMGPIGYLLLEGPIDGTSFARTIEQEEIPDEDIQARIDQELAQLEEADYYDSKDDLVYYDEDADDWDYDSIVRVVAAGYQIDEFFEYAGSWAGDEITLVGDYADNDLYKEPRADAVVKTPDGTEHTLENWGRPRKVIPCGPDENCTARLPGEDAEPGETMQLPSSLDVDDQFAEFVRMEDNEWTDITDGLLAEFAEFVGPEWLEEQTNGRLEMSA